MHSSRWGGGGDDLSPKLPMIFSGKGRWGTRTNSTQPGRNKGPELPIASGDTDPGERSKVRTGTACGKLHGDRRS